MGSRAGEPLCFASLGTLVCVLVRVCLGRPEGLLPGLAAQERRLSTSSLHPSCPVPQQQLHPSQSTCSQAGQGLHDPADVALLQEALGRQAAAASADAGGYLTVPLSGSAAQVGAKQCPFVRHA